MIERGAGCQKVPITVFVYPEEPYTLGDTHLSSTIRVPCCAVCQLPAAAVVCLCFGLQLSAVFLCASSGAVVLFSSFSDRFQARWEALLVRVVRLGTTLLR